MKGTVFQAKPTFNFLHNEIKGKSGGNWVKVIAPSQACPGEQLRWFRKLIL